MPQTDGVRSSRVRKRHSPSVLSTSCPPHRSQQVQSSLDSASLIVFSEQGDNPFTVSLSSFPAGNDRNLFRTDGPEQFGISHILCQPDVFILIADLIAFSRFAAGRNKSQVFRRRRADRDFVAFSLLFPHSCSPTLPCFVNCCIQIVFVVSVSRRLPVR